MHATEIDRTAGKPNQYIYEKEREGVQAADKILAVSGYTKNTLLEHYGVNESKVNVVYNGIDSSKYNTEGDISAGLKKMKSLGYKIVLFVGRITIMKGPDYFLHAAKQVLEHNPKTIFLIAGSGDMEAQIMGQAASMGISDKFVFAGFVRGDDLSEAYRAADLFVMPSVSEPFGLVALEALIHKTPVIISRQSGVSEVLKNAMKVDFWDTTEMADKILSVLDHNSVKKELTDNGFKEAHMCNWDKAADKCIEVYDQLAL
jgi:glycosyltransferase involved in cell wall biosynthesis